MIKKQRCNENSILVFRAMFSLISIVISRNIFINTIKASKGIILDEPISTLMGNGLKHIEYCVIESSDSSKIHVPIIYKAVLEVNNKNTDVYVYTMPKIYTNAKIEIEPYFCDHNMPNNEISANYKENCFFHLKTINHKNINPIIKIFESENFYYCVQKISNDEGNWKKCQDLKDLTLWEAKKLILCYCYGLKALNDNNIIMVNYQKKEMVIDKYFNLRFNQHLNVLRSYKRLGDTHYRIKHHENICLDLYDLSKLSKWEIERFKKCIHCDEHMSLQNFSRKILLKSVLAPENNLEQNKYIYNFSFYEILRTLEPCDASTCINRIINDQGFSNNIISIPDFRKLADKVGETSNYTFVNEGNVLKVHARTNNDLKDEYEFKYTDNTHPIQLNSGNIHYRDFEVRKNGNLIDFDELNEEEFLVLKQEIENLVLEVEKYN